MVRWGGHSSGAFHHRVFVLRIQSFGREGPIGLMPTSWFGVEQGITAYFLPRLPTIRKSSFPKGSQEAIGGITTTKTKSQCPLCQASRAMDVTERGLKCKQEARFSTPCSATNLLRILNSRWISSSLTNT